MVLGKIKHIKGFTIVELLIVVVVISILAAIVVVGFAGVQRSAKESSLKSGLRSASTKIEAVFAETNTYPATLDEAGIAQGSGSTFKYLNDGDSYCLSHRTDSGTTLSYMITNTEQIVAGECAAAWKYIVSNGTLTFGLTNDGRTFSWGSNAGGGLGNGTTTNALSPVDITSSGSLNGKRASKIAATGGGAVVLATDGTLHSWGSNTNGTVGDGTTTQRLNPVNISASGSLAGKSIESISAGGSHVLVKATDGTLHGWGWNAYGQVGTGGGVDQLSAALVSGSGTLSGKTVSKFSAGGSHSFAIATDNTVHAWGFNSNGRLGDGTTTSRLAPVLITNAGTLSSRVTTDIVATGAFSLAITADGALHTWGYGTGGEIGDGGLVQRLQPVTINSYGTLNGKTISQLSYGSNHGFILASDATIHGWGANNNGRLGDGTTTDKSTAVQITSSGALSGKTISKLFSAFYGGFALDTDKQLYGWGGNTSGQLGIGNTTSQLLPILIPGPPSI